MRCFSRLAAVVCLIGCAGLAGAQTDDPEVAKAQAGIDKLRALVAAGAAPRIELERAEDALADARDEASLRKTLYQGQDLTEAQAEGMLAAARRRYDRRQKSESSLSAFQDEVEMSRKECDLAEERARLTRELGQMARAEQAVPIEPPGGIAEDDGIAERYDGNGLFTPGIFARIEEAFESRFGKPLPVSAVGETAVHRALGFDHRGRVDVAINPDQPEGIWLREYLTTNHIPFFAFRQAVPGKATGAHIHLGPMSTRLSAGS
jgi:hypothetical protein